MITLKLAHPLTAAQAGRLRAEDVRDYWIDEEIVVPEDEARGIIRAGYAQVNADDPAAVAAALAPPSSTKKSKSS